MAGLSQLVDNLLVSNLVVVEHTEAHLVGVGTLVHHIQVNPVEDRKVNRVVEQSLVNPEEVDTQAAPRRKKGAGE